MKPKLIAALLLAAVAAAPAAAGYKVKLKGPEAQTIRARNGIHAVDSRTDKTLVRVIAPGLPIGRVGSVRVLVMNLGARPFAFGPDSVTMTLGDGTVLVPIAHERFDRSEQIVSREARIQGATRRRMAANLSGVNTDGATANIMQGGGPGVSNPATPGPSDTESELGVAMDVDQSKIDLMMNTIQDVMRPATVEQMEAAGGYLVFELPAAVRKAKRDQPLTLVVRAGGEAGLIPVILVIHRLNPLVRLGQA